MERRRRVPRLAVTGWAGQCTIESGAGSGPYDCRLLDISTLGVGAEVSLGVRVEGPLPDDLIGHFITLEVLPPTGVSVSVRLTAEVRNTSPGPLGGTRVGMQFVGLTEAERSILQALDLMKAAW